jgi:hypothetical protein
MCHQHQPVPLDQPIRKRGVMVRLSVSVSADLNRLIEEWRLYTGNDKVEIIRQVLWKLFKEHPLPADT